MFQHLRVQILYPCRARCAWCATHRKNERFKRLHEDGSADRIHDFYIETIERYKPREVFLSGGEPLLDPKIGEFLAAIEPHTEQINLFTSYQWSRSQRERMGVERMRLDKVVFNHTPIYFDPEQWSELTQGFPFDVYLENLLFIRRLPARKRFKFIINHERFAGEIQRFQQLVKPDRSCELGLKVINDQGNGLMVRSMARTRALVNERVESLDRLVAAGSWGKVARKAGSVDLMAPLLADGDVRRCAYRGEPIELRFALDQARRDKLVLKYRYCPYFPSDFGHRFHIGRDDPTKLARNYFKGPFRDHCQRCRFLNYYVQASGAERAARRTSIRSGGVA